MREKIWAVIAGAALLSAPLTPVVAAASAGKPVAVSGLIVQLKNESSLDSIAKVFQFRDRPLGGNLYLLRFLTPKTYDKAKSLATALAKSPQVASVSLDESVASSQAARSMRTAIATAKIQVSASVKVSAVQSLRFADTYRPSDPLRGSVKISWRTPAKLGGGKLVGYEVYRNFTSSASFQFQKRISSRSFSVGDLTPGQEHLFKIVAIVKKGSSLYRGTSRTIAVVSTAAPRPPVLLTATTITRSSHVSWMHQAPVQRGGLAVSYKVTATSGSEIATCQTSSDECLISLPANAGAFTVRVVASNAKGASSSREAPVLQDSNFDRQWYLNSSFGINAQNAWTRTKGSPAVTVAVIDSGITNHQDLTGSLFQNEAGRPYGFDFVSDANLARDGDGWDSNPADEGDYTTISASSWHGTRVAGLIAATHNQFGIAGVAPEVKLVSVRAIGTDGGKLSDLLAAVNWASGVSVPGTPVNLHPARLINLSLSTETDLACSVAAQAVFDQAYQRGVTIVTAAGNRAVDASVSFPANCVGVVSVAATTSSGNLASYSNFGASITVAAPGGSKPEFASADYLQAIFSTSNEGLNVSGVEGFAYATGTSMAAPLVTGVLALMLSADDTLTRAQLISMLKASAKTFAAQSACRENGLCGAGIVDAAVAVELAALKHW